MRLLAFDEPLPPLPAVLEFYARMRAPAPAADSQREEY
jgi:hypothetical protein